MLLAIILTQIYFLEEQTTDLFHNVGCDNHCFLSCKLAFLAALLSENPIFVNMMFRLQRLIYMNIKIAKRLVFYERVMWVSFYTNHGVKSVVGITRLVLSADILSVSSSSFALKRANDKKLSF